jgi:hypothetical protein
MRERVNVRGSLLLMGPRYPEGRSPAVETAAVRGAATPRMVVRGHVPPTLSELLALAVVKAESLTHS